MYKISIVLIILTLAGCATGNISNDYQVDKTKDNGLVIGSLTQEKGFPGGTNAKIYFDQPIKTEWEEKEGDSFKWIETKPENFLLGTMAFKSQFNDVDGRVFVIELPAGYHNFTNWFISTGNATIRPTSVPPPKEFLVEKNKIVYVGNFHFTLFKRKDLLGISQTSGGFPLIQDKQERDLKIFKEMHPELQNKEVDIRVLPTGNWGSQESGKLYKPIIIPAS